MFKKFLSLGLSLLSLGAVLTVKTSARVLNSSSDEKFVAAQVQKQIMKDAKAKSANSKISKIKSEISRNESAIKALERRRSELDNELAVQYQLMEILTSNRDLKNAKNKVKRIQSKISSNEKNIKKLKDKRNSLDGELAVQLQLQEVNY